MRSATAVAAAVMTCAMCAASAAGERTGWYAGVSGGANATDADGIITSFAVCNINSCPTLGAPVTISSGDANVAFFGTIGFEIGAGFRVEGEVGYRGGETVLDEDLDQTTWMLNALYDLPISDSLTLSIGGGIGLDQLSWVAFGSSDYTRDVFAAQGIAGLSIGLTDNIDLTVDYRYLSASEVSSSNVLIQDDAINSVYARIDDVTAQSVSVGVRFAL
jgi:opacity protein-like surface antigen